MLSEYFKFFNLGSLVLWDKLADALVFEKYDFCYFYTDLFAVSLRKVYILIARVFGYAPGPKILKYQRWEMLLKWQ